MSADDVDSIAAALLMARRRGELTIPALPLSDVEDAYRIQDAVLQRHGAVDGWKVGAKNQEATPTCAPLLGGTVVKQSDGLGYDIPVRGFVGVELEVAYRINRDFAAGSAVDDQEILEAIASVHIAVELCASRLPDDSPPLWLLADNQMNERLVVGEALSSWWNLQDASAKIAVDEKVLVSTIGGHPIGDPFRLVLWLVRHCTKQPTSRPASTSRLENKVTALRDFRHCRPIAPGLSLRCPLGPRPPCRMHQ